jgi:drug/metabolite transporter (DMT)-like permease
MYALFASVFPVGKVTLEYTQPFFLTGVRMILAGALLLLYLRIKKPSLIYAHKKHWPLLFLIGLFNVCITNSFEFWGLQYMTSAKTCLIYTLSPFAAIIFSYFFLKEKMNLRKWAGLILGLLGFIPIYISGAAKAETTQSIFFFSTAEIAVTISAITAVFGWIFLKKLTTRYNYPFVTANAISFIIGGILSFIPSVMFESWHPVPISNTTYFIYGLLYIAIIHNVLCYNIYAYCLQKFTVTFMTFAGTVSPIFTAIFAFIFLNEKVTIAFFISLALVTIGLFIFSFGELSQIKLKKKLQK